MHSRRLRRLAALLVVAGVGLGAPAAAFAEPPPNDGPGGALPPPADIAWTTLNPPVDVAWTVSADAWLQASDAPSEDRQPSCTGASGFGERSLWFRVPVAEPSILRATVVPTFASGFEPVVTILTGDPATDAGASEVGCGSATGATGDTSRAVAEGYVMAGTAYVRVAQIGGTAPFADYRVLIAGKDVTPPRISVKIPAGPAESKARQRYDAGATLDRESGIDETTAVWTFHDGPRKKVVHRGSLSTTYTWTRVGTHLVDLAVADRANNFNTYSFPVVVQDRTPPQIGLSLAVPFPGDRRLHLVLTHDERVDVRFVIFQGGRRLFTVPRKLVLAGRGRARRVVRVTRAVASSPRLVITGTARDSAGNTTQLPPCEVDPVSGAGSCYTP